MDAQRENERPFWMLEKYVVFGKETFGQKSPEFNSMQTIHNARNQSG